MSIRTVRAFILHRREVTESSLILTVFSDRAGKISLLAKGARRKKSPFLGRTELFSLCNLTYYESRRRGLNILSESDIIDPLDMLGTSLQSFMTACYLAELVDMGTCPSSSIRGLFDLLYESLGSVQLFPEPSVLKRYFELHLLSHLGYSPQLYDCSCCHGKRERMRLFSVEAGGMLCGGCAASSTSALKISPGTLAALRYLKVNPLRSARSLRLARGQAEEARRILRAAILYYLERLPKTELVK